MSKHKPGDALVRKMSRTPAERFWEKINKTGTCWLWTAATNYGYGLLGVNYQNKRAHRFSWELHYGPIPKGLWVLHKCDTPPCVNPEHLYLGTIIENGRDTRERMTAVRGEQHGRHKLTEEQVREIRSSYKWRTITEEYLSQKYGVSRTSIRNIVKYRKWRHVAA